MGPEYIAVIFSAVISSLTGGSWVAGKVLERHRERLNDHFRAIHNKLDKLVEKLIDK